MEQKEEKEGYTYRKPYTRNKGKPNEVEVRGGWVKRRESKPKPCAGALVASVAKIRKFVLAGIERTYSDIFFHADDEEFNPNVCPRGASSKWMHYFALHTVIPALSSPGERNKICMLGAMVLETPDEEKHAHQE